MPNVKEMGEILEATPIEQAIMLEGIHGIGKSEFIKDYFKSKGYTTIMLFLGQMADAGDIIGLPDRTEIEVDGKRMKITEFCPPKWWPTNEKLKIVIFMDEANRGKPEINQCVMDMVLNRMLNGRKLPPLTRIIAAINPLQEGYYQVEEMDPALVDRFNKYEFKPSVDDWMDWAVKEKVNKLVLGFISRHNDHLDPPVADEYKAGKVYPSRRSWKRVSDILNNNTKLTNPDQLTLLQNIMLGIVGERSVSSFRKYIKEVGTGITAGKILTDFNSVMEGQLLTLNTQDFIHLNKQIAMWLEQNVKLLKESDPKDKTSMGIKITGNLERYLELIPEETMAEFFNLVSIDNDKKKEWPEAVMSTNPHIADKFIGILHCDLEGKKGK